MLSQSFSFLRHVLSSPVALAIGILLSLILWGVTITVYRVTFHPLAKYPGPFLAKFTNWYEAYYAWRGDRHLEYWRCHEKYGKFVRFAPNTLSINSNTAMKEIYGFKSNVRKADFYTAFWANNRAFNTHNVIDKNIHSRKRRVMSAAFSDHAISSIEQHILANIKTFCNALGERSLDASDSKGWSAPKNLGRWSDYLAFDIMSDLAFGRSFGTLERDNSRFAIDLVSSAAHRHLICGTNLSIHKYGLDKYLFAKIAADRAKYMQFSKSLLGERQGLGALTNKKDIFHYLLTAKDPETGQGFADAELWGESNLLIIAGSDTTSTSLAGTWFYLAHNPLALQKATAEVRDKFSNVEEISSGPKLNSCVYIRACIDEAMRLSPPVGGPLPRQVLPGGMEVDGEFIPEGAVVGVPSYTLHHNSEYHPDPFTYKPERWIANAVSSVTDNTVQVAQSAFLPFSIGPRGCIGKGLAYTEMMNTVARALWMYDMRLAPGQTLGEGKPGAQWGRHRPNEFQLMDTFTSAKDGPIVQFRPRCDVGI